MLIREMFTGIKWPVLPINVGAIRVWLVYLFQDDSITIAALQDRTNLSIDNGYNAENCKHLLCEGNWNIFEFQFKLLLAVRTTNNVNTHKKVLY